MKIHHWKSALIYVCVSLVIIAICVYFMRCFNNRAQKRREKEKNAGDLVKHSNGMQKLYPRHNLNQYPFENVNCCICLNDFSEKIIGRILPCTHVFHEECIDNWTLCKHECPICKKGIDMYFRRLSSITILPEKR